MNLRAKKQTAYEKGLELEKEFAEYVKKEMGYERIKIRFQVKQMNNNMGANIDIIGERLNKNGKLYKKLGIIYLVLCGGLILYSLVTNIVETMHF